MKTVKAVVYGKEYTLACDEGQEQHLQQLVQQLNARAKTPSPNCRKAS
jgi:cell division protein ZapA (FtsZ GTPase activity inhibitor)